MPIRPSHSSGSRRATAGRAHLAAPGSAALLTVALGALFGCGAPSPPQPSGASQLHAAAQARSAQAKSSLSVPPVPQVSSHTIPAPPQGLAAIPVRNVTGSLEVDLSWAISSANDLAGYNVYRSQGPLGPDRSGARLNRELLAVPAFRDTTVLPGLSYRYQVTAVDAEGNESAPSAPVTVSVPGSGAGSP